MILTLRTLTLYAFPLHAARPNSNLQQYLPRFCYENKFRSVKEFSWPVPEWPRQSPSINIKEQKTEKRTLEQHQQGEWKEKRSRKFEVYSLRVVSLQTVSLKTVLSFVPMLLHCHPDTAAFALTLKATPSTPTLWPNNFTWTTSLWKVSPCPQKSATILFLCYTFSCSCRTINKLNMLLTEVKSICVLFKAIFSFLVFIFFFIKRFTAFVAWWISLIPV